MTTEMEMDDERLVDVFQEVVKEFPSIHSFSSFALSKDGLLLEEHEVCHIQADHKHSAEEQKMKMLAQWRMNQGTNACPALIRETVAKYRETHSIEADSVPLGQAPVIHHQAIGTEAGGPVSVTNTYITGPVHGPLLMGNESVMLTDPNCSSLTHGADSDPPALKPDKYKIPADNKETISIGGCSVKFPAHSATEPTPVCLGYKKDATAPPGGYVYASSTLTCTPSFQGRQDQKITLPTWCRGNHVDAGIFQKDTKGNWGEIDKLPLTREGHLVLYRRTLDNVTAFVPTEKLKDIQFSVSCFLFNNPDGKFAMGFCLKDEAVENVFLHKLKKESYCRTFKSLDDLTVTLGDEIHYRISPGQQMQNTKFFIDEEFITSHAGHISYCELRKCSSKPSYIVEHMRQDGDGDLKAVPSSGFSREISEKEDSDAGDCSAAVVFQGHVDVGNVFGKVDDVKIDQRVGAAPQSKPFWEDHNEDVVSYEEKAGKISREKPKKSKGCSPTISGAAVMFKGPVKAQNVIGQAKSVFIDQRRNGGNGESRPFMARRKMRLEKQIKAQQPLEKGPEEGVQEERPLTKNIRAPAQNYAQPFVEEENLKPSLTSSHDKGFQRVEQPVVYGSAPSAQNTAVPFMDEKLTKPDGGNKTVKSSSVDHESAPAKVASGKRYDQLDSGVGAMRKRKLDTKNQTPAGAEVSEPAAQTSKGEEKCWRYDNTHIGLAAALMFCLVCLAFTLIAE